MKATKHSTEESGEATKTGGRKATTRHIPGAIGLSVGMPADACDRRLDMVKAHDLARLESGHTPSRKHPEYWSGDIPWIGLRDAKANHAGVIADTEQHTNDLGIANSSARILPSTRSASHGRHRLATW